MISVPVVLVLMLMLMLMVGFWVMAQGGCIVMAMKLLPLVQIIPMILAFPQKQMDSKLPKVLTEGKLKKMVNTDGLTKKETIGFQPILVMLMAGHIGTGKNLAEAMTMCSLGARLGPEEGYRR